MVQLAGDFTDHTVLIYNANGNHVVDTVIVEYDKMHKQILVESLPEVLKPNDNCRLLILTSPAPVEYSGKLKRIGKDIYIAIYQGRVVENRSATRFKVSTPAIIDSYISGGQHYKLHTPITVTLINISTTGVRFRAPYKSLTKDDSFRIIMNVGGNNKALIAQVVNFINNEPVTSDYGCCFVS